MKTKNDKKYGWKIFALVNSILLLLGIVLILKDVNFNPVELFFELTVGLILASSLFGYAFDKKILNRKVWQFFQCYALMVIVYGLSASSYSNLSETFIIICIFLYMTPSIYALMKYTRSLSNEVQTKI